MLTLAFHTNVPVFAVNELTGSLIPRETGLLDMPLVSGEFETLHSRALYRGGTFGCANAHSSSM